MKQWKEMTSDKKQLARDSWNSQATHDIEKLILRTAKVQEDSILIPFGEDTSELQREADEDTRQENEGSWVREQQSESGAQRGGYGRDY